jgi:hypothetical protein
MRLAAHIAATPLDDMADAFQVFAWVIKVRIEQDPVRFKGSFSFRPGSFTTSPSEHTTEMSNSAEP